MVKLSDYAWIFRVTKYSKSAIICSGACRKSGRGQLAQGGETAGGRKNLLPAIA